MFDVRRQRTAVFDLFRPKLAHDLNMALSARRAIFEEAFGGFEPEAPARLEDGGRPYDADHLARRNPRAQRASRGAWKCRGNAIGNKRAWPLADCRKDRDGPPARKPGKRGGAEKWRPKGDPRGIWKDSALGLSSGAAGQEEDWGL